ncbi:MAG: MFS transporter [Ruthenibacterium lactatiformans]
MKHTRLTFAAFVVLMVGLGSSDSLRGIFSPVFSSHFALSATQLGLIVTVSYIGNLVFLLVGGNVIERFEKKKALLALTGIWMAALAVFAFTDNYYLLLAGMFCAMGASTLLNTTLNLVTPLLFASSPAFFVNLLFFTQGIGTSGSQSLLGRYATDIGFWHKTNLVLLALGAAAVLLLAFSTVPGPRADGPHPAKRQSGVLKNRGRAAARLCVRFLFHRRARCDELAGGLRHRGPRNGAGQSIQLSGRVFRRRDAGPSGAFAAGGQAGHPQEHGRLRLALCGAVHRGCCGRRGGNAALGGQRLFPFHPVSHAGHEHPPVFSAWAGGGRGRHHHQCRVAV